jgi:hypothetical protein
MKHKTSELTGALLDAAVAKAEGYIDLDSTWWETAQGRIGKIDYQPSDDWEHGGPIIERERISIVYSGEYCAWQWTAGASLKPEGGCGETPLIAAMRAYVAHKLGEEVEL